MPLEDCVNKGSQITFGRLYFKQSSATLSKSLMHLRFAYSQDTFRGSQRIFTCRSWTKIYMTYSFTKGRNLTVDENGCGPTCKSESMHISLCFVYAHLFTSKRQYVV